MQKIHFYNFHVFSVARDHILILNILFFNKLRQIIPEIRSERRDLLIFIFILKTTGTLTPVHSTFLEAKNVTGLESISGDLENQLNIYLKLFYNTIC